MACLAGQLFARRFFPGIAVCDNRGKPDTSASQTSLPLAASNIARVNIFTLFILLFYRNKRFIMINNT